MSPLELLYNDLRYLEGKYGVTLVDQHLIDSLTRQLGAPVYSLPTELMSYVKEREVSTGVPFTGSTVADAASYINTTAELPTVKQTEYMMKISKVTGIDCSYVRTKSQASNYIENNKKLYRILKANKGGNTNDLR